MIKVDTLFKKPLMLLMISSVLLNCAERSSLTDVTKKDNLFEPSSSSNPYRLAAGESDVEARIVAQAKLKAKLGTHFAKVESSALSPLLTETVTPTKPFSPGADPESPQFRTEQQFHEAEPMGRTTPQYYRALRPTIPSLRTSHDGRLGFGWGTGLLYLLAPEKMKDHLPFSQPGLEILVDPRGTDSRFGWDNFLMKAGETWSFAGVTICNHVPRDEQPRKCGKNDCYDLSYLGFYTKKSSGSSVKDLAYFRSRKVVVEVASPKTPQARIIDVRVAPGSELRERSEPIQVDTAMVNRDFMSFEPVTTSDGRLYVSRMSGNGIKNSGNPNKTVDVYYMVAPLSAEPCDASAFSAIKRMPKAPYDPDMRHPPTATGKPRYGIAEYPMVDSFGRPIPEDGFFPTYPWIDRAGNNLFFSTGGSTLNTFPWQFQSIETAEPGYFVGDWVMLQNSERYPSRCLPDFPDCKQNRYNPEDRGGVRGYAVLGSWTRGKTVVFDGLVNHTDYGLKRGPRYHREIQLYQPEPGFDGHVRIGSGREAGANGNGITNDLESYAENSEIQGMGGPTGTMDSLENLFNTYRFLRPLFPRDVVWTLNTGIGSEEIIFDDSLDNRALIVSSMVAGAEFQSMAWWHDEWKYADGFTRKGDGAKDQAAQPVLIQNAATSTDLPIPAYGYLNIGRIEPIALGGIHGRGLWLDGSNSLSYTFPRGMSGSDLFFSVFFDSRSSDETLRQLAEFPDGTQILVNSQELKIQKGSEVVSVFMATVKRSWTHLGIGVSSGGKVIDVYWNGMKFQTLNTQSAFFAINGGLVLRLGKTERKTTPGFRGWIDEFKLFAYVPTAEVICNHAFGSLYWVKPGSTSAWQTTADRYPLSSHSDIFNQLPGAYVNEKSIPSTARFVCGANYSSYKEIYRALLRESEGLASIREALLFAVPHANGFEDGRLSWNSQRVDYRANKFCLTCHSDLERRGLMMAALEPSQICSMDDVRRQPLQAPSLLVGQQTNQQLAAISATPNSIPKIYEPRTQGLLTDPIWFLTKSGGGSCSNAGPADLIVTGLNWTPASPKTGDLLTITASVKNQGKSVVPKGTWMGATISLNGNLVTWAGADLVADLAPGGSIQVSTPTAQRLQVQAGTWNLSTAIDDQNLVVEADEGNNTLAQSLTVVEPPPVPITPPKVKLTNPTNGATGVRKNPVFKWTSSGAVDFYYVDVSTTSKFEKFWNLRLPAEARQVTYSGSSGGWGAVNEIPAPAALKAGKTYYVRVAAFFDSGRQIIHTKTVKFKVKSP